MKLNERLQEAFDKRVCGTAMLPASDLLSAMTAIEQAEADNATLKEQVAAWKLTAEQHKENFDIINGDLREQLATVTMQRDLLKDALKASDSLLRELPSSGGFYGLAVMENNAIALAPLKGE